jgi:Spy/CpxP family protein refolding chaperone
MGHSRRRGARAALALAALLVAPRLAGAWPGEPPPGPPGGGPPGGFIGQDLDQLGLAPETRAQIDRIVADARARGEALRPQIEAAHRTLHDLLTQGAPDQEAVMHQAEALGALELSEHKNRLEAMLAIRALLTPEQRDQLVRSHEEGRGRWKHHRGPLGACSTDAKGLCAGAEGGRARLSCLAERYDALSSPCREALESK